MSERKFWLAAAITGNLGGLCYVAAVLVPWPENQLGTSLSILVISGWPILSIIYYFALNEYIAAERQSAANRLAFLFTLVAFTTVLAMIIVQVAVVAGTPKTTVGLDAELAKTLKRNLRWVDLGLDVAWDFLFGTALICWGVAMRRCSGFGNFWSIPSIVFGVLLIGLNASTFPQPPAVAGLFDIGPFIAAYMMAVTVRFTVLVARAPAPMAVSTTNTTIAPALIHR